MPEHGTELAAVSSWREIVPHKVRRLWCVAKRRRAQRDWNIFDRAVSSWSWTRCTKFEPNTNHDVDVVYNHIVCVVFSRVIFIVR